MRRRRIILVLLVLAVVAAVRSVFFVDETEMVIVTQFGRPVRTLGQAGLYLKPPYQSLIRMDRRLQIYDPRPSEFLTSEKKNVDLDAFVCWRVGEPRRFLEAVSEFAGAEARIHDIVWSELAAEIGRHPLEALLSTDPEVHRLDEIMETVAHRCAERSKTAYGIDIVDVRLKRIVPPAQVRESVFQRMRAERARMVRRYRAEGEEEAMKIRAAADKERTILLADAYAKAEETRGQGEAEATRIYAEAHRQDPRFYELLRALEAYRKFLDEKTTILLSADSDLLKFLTRGSMLSATSQPQ